MLPTISDVLSGLYLESDSYLNTVLHSEFEKIKKFFTTISAIIKLEK